MENFNEANATETAVYDILKTVIDPELGINIIDLGLIYKIEFTSENGLLVELTLSTKGCPMGDTIMNDIETSIREKFPDIKSNVVLVWEPKWSPKMVTPAGREALGFMPD